MLCRNMCMHVVLVYAFMYRKVDKTLCSLNNSKIINMLQIYNRSMIAEIFALMNIILTTFF